MNAQRLGFFARFALALRILFDSVLAARARQAAEGALPTPAPAPELPARPEAPAAPKGPDVTPALQLLALLQREGRLIDFLQEDVAAFSDAEVGAAARVVHEGCKRVLDEYFTVRPVRSEAEGDAVVLEAGFDARKNRLTGNVTGEPPYKGSLAHPGWEVTDVRLPTLSAGHEARIVAPAEIEL